MASMEAMLLMGCNSSGSEDSDADDNYNCADKAGTQVTASTTAAAMAAHKQPPPLVVAEPKVVGAPVVGPGHSIPSSRRSSKSELTNQVKNLYNSPPPPPEKTPTPPQVVKVQPKQMAGTTATNGVTGGAPIPVARSVVLPPTTASSSSSRVPAAAGVVLPGGENNAVNNPNSYIPSMVHYTNLQPTQHGSPQKQPQQPTQQPSQQQYRQPLPHGIHPTGTVPQQPVQSAIGRVPAASLPKARYMTNQEKKEKELFLMFTGVLMKYLKQRDTKMHAAAIAQIKICYKMKELGDPTFESLTVSLKARLRSTVGENYWKKAHMYLDHFLKQKRDLQARHQGQVQVQLDVQPHPQIPSGHSQQSLSSVPPPIVQTLVQPPRSNALQQHQHQQHLTRQLQTSSPSDRSSGTANNPSTIPVSVPTIANNTAATSSISILLPVAQPLTLTSSEQQLEARKDAIQKAAKFAKRVSWTTMRPKVKDRKKVNPKKTNEKKKKVTTSTTSKIPSSLTRKPLRTQERGPRNLMETIDHAVLMDVKSLPNLVSNEHMLDDFNLNEEQRTLLYGHDKQRCFQVKDITKAASEVLDVEPPRLASMLDGWGKNNVMSARSAWAKVRMPEGEERCMEREKELERVVTRERRPMVSESANRVWFNETRAEQDPTLALLSEATELFLKSSIENAISKARRQKNLDGVRLCHTLISRSASPKVGSIGIDKPPPSTLIRLGCDVRRQIALAEGNAAKTYQRMEEAISRQNDTMYHSAHPAQGNNPYDGMLLEATSMADLSKRPPLKSASQVADADATRKYAVFFGGIDGRDREPLFGHVPKKARVTLRDLGVGDSGNQASMIGSRRKRFRVGLRY